MSFGHKKINEILQQHEGLAMTSMDIENILLSERSHTQKTRRKGLVDVRFLLEDD